MHSALLKRDKQLLSEFQRFRIGKENPALTEGAVIGRIGPLEVRLAASTAEIEAAQEIRFRVFYEELGARRPTGAVGERDLDRFDSICDHLLVLDNSLPGPQSRRVVGTYRLLRQEVAEAGNGFYSSEEFEIEKLVERHRALRFLELGRSCVLPDYRSKRTIEVLWQGIWAYITHHDISVMCGCASFHGAVPARHAEALSFLAHHVRAEPLWDVSAVPARRREMDLMPVEAVRPRSAMSAMPPLIKGYLRLGARFGDGCVVDEEFGTVDVFVILPVHAIARRYLNYYSGGELRGVRPPAHHPVDLRPEAL